MPIPLSLGWPLLKFDGECWFVAMRTLPDGVKALSLMPASAAGKRVPGHLNIRSISCIDPHNDFGNEIRSLIDNEISFLIKDHGSNSGLGHALQKAGVVRLIGKPINLSADEQLRICSLVEEVRVPAVEEVLDPFRVRES